MISRQSNIHRFRLPAGPHPFAINAPGRYFKVLTSPERLTVKLGDMAASDFFPGQGIAFLEPDEFDRLEITNPTAAPMWVEVWIGYVAFIDDRRDNMESPTASAGLGIDSIDANTTQDVPPVLTGTRVRRKAVLVANLDSGGGNLLVLDAAGEVVGVVFSGQCCVFPISGPCQVRNGTPTPIACHIGEIYWTR